MKAAAATILALTCLASANNVCDVGLGPGTCVLPGCCLCQTKTGKCTDGMFRDRDCDAKPPLIGSLACGEIIQPEPEPTEPDCSPEESSLPRINKFLEDFSLGPLDIGPIELTRALSLTLEGVTVDALCLKDIAFNVTIVENDLSKYGLRLDNLNLRIKTDINIDRRLLGLRAGIEINVPAADFLVGGDCEQINPNSCETNLAKVIDTKFELKYFSGGAVVPQFLVDLITNGVVGAVVPRLVDGVCGLASTATEFICREDEAYERTAELVGLAAPGEDAVARPELRKRLAEERFPILKEADDELECVPEETELPLINKLVSAIDLTIPSIGPIALGDCEDAPSAWQDFSGDDCATYASSTTSAGQPWCGRRGVFGDTFKGTDGRTANEACCECGGGKSDLLLNVQDLSIGGICLNAVKVNLTAYESTITSLGGRLDGLSLNVGSAFSMLDDDSCEDAPVGWSDFSGDDCQVYASSTTSAGQPWCGRNGVFGDSFTGTDGRTANQACCECEGGSRAEPVVSGSFAVEIKDMRIGVGAACIDGKEQQVTCEHNLAEAVSVKLKIDGKPLLQPIIDRVTDSIVAELLPKVVDAVCGVAENALTKRCGETACTNGSLGACRESCSDIRFDFVRENCLKRCEEKCLDEKYPLSFLSA